MTLEWQSTVVENPRWSSQTVYYNPRNPSDALLEPGVDGGDLLLLLFALPLNVLTGTLWRAMLTRLLEFSTVRPAGGVRILKRSGETRVPLGDTTATGAGFYTMGIAAFIAAFPVVVIGGFDPPMRVMKVSWTVILALGAAAFVWRLLRNWSGIYDLRIEQNSQTIILPRAAGRSENLSISRREISGVSLQRRVSEGPSGVHLSFLPALNQAGGDDPIKSMKLITWGWGEEKARAFSQWLGQELGVEFKGVEDEKPESVAKT